MNHAKEITPEMLHPMQAGEDKLYYKMQENRIVYAKRCEHCHGAFFPKRSDQKYCSGSCRVLACRKRKGYTYQTEKYQKHLPAEQPTLARLLPQEPKPAEKKFNWQHVGESAVATAAVAGAKYLAHDRPMMQKLDRVLQHLERKEKVLVKIPVSKLPLHFLGLHKHAKTTMALFKDPQTEKIISCDNKGRWWRLVSSKPERWELIKR